MMISTCDELNRQLAGYSGTDTYYCLPYQSEADKPKTIYTNGVRAMARKCDAYWLIQLIEETQHTEEGIDDQPFQVYRISSTGNNVLIVVDDGREVPEFTFKTNLVQRFPVGDFKVWCVDNVILLPSEY